MGVLVSLKIPGPSRQPHLPPDGTRANGKVSLWPIAVGCFVGLDLREGDAGMVVNANVDEIPAGAAAL
ncbi:hypothetical protein, partial [Bradyrhizobium sp. Ec3.3]|uniref:hypothetical protein n=1 Tax=Bradyrhizobium sp. Ec3.3 TaxID=189753 RepID=UPI001AEBC3C5